MPVGKITSLSQAVRNANDAISMISTYDGAADEIETILIRMRELATLAQNGTYTSTDLTNADDIEAKRAEEGADLKECVTALSSPQPDLNLTAI